MTPCIMPEWLLSCRKQSHLRKILRSCFRIGITIRHEGSVYCAYEKALVFSARNASENRRMDFFFFLHGRECFCALHHVNSTILQNWLMFHRKLLPGHAQMTYYLCRKHSECFLHGVHGVLLAREGGVLSAWGEFFCAFFRSGFRRGVILIMTLSNNEDWLEGKWLQGGLT